MTHQKVKNILQFFFFISSLILLTQGQSCNTIASLPTQLTLYTGETFRYYLLDYFSGSSMSFATMSLLSSYSRIVPNYAATTTATNAIPPFIEYKIFKQAGTFEQGMANSMAFLYQKNSSFYVQAFQPQTASTPISNLTAPIKLTGLPTDTICFDLTYLSIGQVLVDCYSQSQHLNYLVPVSLTAQIMLNNTQSFQEITTFSSTMSRKMITTTLNNQIYVLRYAYSQYLPAGNNNTYIAIFNIQLSSTAAYGPTIFQLPPIDGNSFGLVNFWMQNLVIKGQNLFIYEVSSQQILKTQLNFQGLTIKLPQLGSILVNASVTVMDSFYDGENYTLVYALSGSGVYEVDWTTNIPYTKYVYPLNAQTVNFNKLIIGQQYILTFFNNNLTTSIMEVYMRGSVAYPMLQFYNTSFFKYQSIIEMDQLSGAVYSFGNLYSATNSDQMIQLQLPFIEFASNAVDALTDFVLTCTTNYNNNTSAASPTTFQVQSLQAGQVSITPQQGTTVGMQTLQASYPGETYDDLSRYYKGPGLQYTFQANTTNPWTASYQIASYDNYYSKQNFQFPLSNSQTLDPSNVIFLKQIQLFSGIYEWYVQDSNYTMYTFLQNYESDEQYMEYYLFDFQWSAKAINIELLDPWVAIFAQGTSCSLYFYNSHSQTFFQKSLCDSTKYQITYFNLIENQLYVSINDINSSSTTRRNGQLLTATVSLSNFYSNSAFNQIQWSQFSTIQSLTNFYPQMVYSQWRSFQQIIYIQCEQSTIVYNTQYNIIYQTIIPQTTPYQLSFTPNFLLLIESNNIEQYAIYNPQQIYKTINYPSYTFAHTPCYSTSQQGVQFTENLTLIYDQCNSQIVVLLPQKDENQVFQTIIPASDFNFFTIARAYKIPIVISVLGKSSLNLINYAQFELLRINSYLNQQSAAVNQSFYFQVTVSSVFNTTLTQTIPYTFVNYLNQYYPIQQSSTAEIDFANYFAITATTGKLTYKISPHQWFKGMIANFTVACTQTNSNSAVPCGNLATVLNTVAKNRTIGGKTGYFVALAKGNKFNYALSSNKLFRIYNSTNNFYDFTQLPFNVQYGGSCYVLAVADNEQFAVTACLNGTWRIYITSFLSSEPTSAGSFQLNNTGKDFHINKLIIKDNYLFVVLGGISLKDGFRHVQIIKLNFDNFQSTSLFTPIANFTLRSNKMFYGLEHFITSFDIQKTETQFVYRFFLTDFLGNLYTNLFTPSSPNAYFTNFIKLNIYYYLDSDVQAARPILTGMKLFNFQILSQESAYKAVLVFGNFHSYEVLMTFSSTTQGFALSISNKYLQYGIYENTGNVDVMNQNDGFVVIQTVLPESFVNDPNYAGYPIQLLLAYDRTNKSFTAYSQSSASYPLTVISGAYSFQSDEAYFPFVAQGFPSTNASQDSNYSVLILNPDTDTLDTFNISRYIQVTLDSSASSSFSTLQLNAYNNPTPQAFQFSLVQEISGGGSLSAQTCSGLYAFPPSTITQSETSRFNLLDYFIGPNIAYSITAPTANVVSIPAFINNVTNAASQGIVPYYVSQKVYKPFSAWTKEWQQQMAVLYYDYANSGYKIQQYTVPTVNSQMQAVNQPIALNFGPDIKCFDLEYLDSNTILVDCHSYSQYLNYFVIITNILTTSPTASYISSSPYQSLSNPPLNRHIFIYQGQGILYIFRSQYAQDYDTADQQFATQTFIEQYAYQNQQLNQLFPITATLCQLTQLSISNIQVSQKGYIFIQNGLSIYKIGPSFLGVSITPKEFDTYTSSYIANIYGMAVNTNGTSIMVYAVIQATDNSFYIQEIDWTNPSALSLTSRININNYIAQVTQISASNDFIIMAYNNQNKQAFGSYLDIYSIGYSQTIFQMPFSNMQNFTHDKFNNYLILLQNTRTMSQNTQQMFTIAIPYLYLQSAAVVTQSTFTIGCTSTYYTISNVANEIQQANPANPTQASEPLILTVNSLNSVQLTPISSGVYNSLAQSQAPGQAIMDLTQFYTGPSIQFSFVGTGASATNWPTDYKIYNFNTAYSNSAFAFNDSINSKMIPVSNVTYFKQFQFGPDIMFWILQDTTNKLYTFGELVIADTIQQFEFQPATLTSQVQQLEFATQDVSVLVETNYNCTVYFYNSLKQTLFYKTMCNSSSTSSITHIKVIKDIIYIFVQNSQSSFVSQVRFNKYNFHNNTAFAWLDWSNQITSTSFLNIQVLSNFVPLRIYQSLNHDNRVVMKCASYILIFDPYSYHIFGQIPVSTSYQIAVTANDYLTIIQPTMITEYNFYDSLNIYMTKAAYPSYAGSSFSISEGDIHKTDYFVYIHQTTLSQILVIQPGNPMMSAVQNIITLSANYKFFAVEKSFDNVFETISVFGTNYLYVYNSYIQKSLQISSQSLSNAGNLTFNITFQSQFESTPSHNLPFTFQQTPNTQMFTIGQSPSTTIDFAGFINIETFVGSGSFSFIPHSWFTGVITSYSINCTQSCQNNVAIQPPIGLQRQITPKRYFVDVKKGASFTYAQSANKVFRLTTYLNQIYDMVTLPFSEMQKQCSTLAVAPSEYYSVSGCSNGENSYVYMVSYLSSEPHVFGSFRISNITNIQSMILLNNYLFIIDGAEDIKMGFNGIAIYYLDFTATATSIVRYIDTFTTAKFSFLALLTTINSIDIQPGELANSYRFFFADSSNYMHTILFQPNQINPLQYYQTQQSIFITHYLDSEAQAQKNLEFVGVKAFNPQITTGTTAAQAAYNLIIVFKNFHTYEVQMQFSGSLVQTILVNKFLLNGFYQNQNNFDVINYNNDGFLVIQGILPQRIAENSSYSSLSKQVLMVYDRTNLSFTQTSGSTINSTIIMATYPFLTLLPIFRFVAQIYPGATQTNYSILAISPDDFSFNNIYLQRNAKFIVSSIDFTDNSLDLILANDITNSKYTFNVTKETGQNGTLATSNCNPYNQFPALTLGISEYYEFKLSDYFEGENLQFTIQPTTQTVVSVNSQFVELPNSGTYGVLNEFNYMSILKTVDSSLIAWDQYGVTLTQFSLTQPAYMATRYLLPTANTKMSISGQQINFTLNPGALCYEIIQVTANIALVDCIDMQANVNNLIVIDFSKNTSTTLIQPLMQQLNSAPLWRHLHMMVSQSGLIYLFRTMYKSEYQTNDTASSSAGFIETFSYYNGKITAYTLGLTLLELQQVEVSYQSLFIQDAITNKIYKITPNFLSLSYSVYPQDTYSIPGTLFSFSVLSDGNSILLATTVNQINYLYQVTWLTKIVAVKYFLNSNINQIAEIFGTPEFLAVEYNNGQSGTQYIGYIDIYEAMVPRVLFQRQISQSEFYLFNPFKNQMLVLLDTQTLASNYVSLWQITSQSLIINAQQAAAQQGISIVCSSLYYTINGTNTVRRSLQQIVSVTFELTVQPANAVVITNLIPLGNQPLYTQYPGSLYFGINYYSGPLLQYSIKNVSLPTNTTITLQQNYPLYINPTFNFTIGSTTLYPSDVTTFFDQILVEPGVFLWVFQDKSYNTYKQLIDIRSGIFNIIDMAAAQQQLGSSLINYQKVFPFIVAYAVSGTPCTMNFYNFDKGLGYTYSFCQQASNEQIQNFNIFGNQIYIYTTKSNIYTAKLNQTQFNNYGSFQSIQWTLLNSLILDQSVLNLIQQCNPQQMIPYKSNGVYAIKCTSSIIIINLQTQVYYASITPKTTNSFLPAFVQSYLIVVEPTNIEEYNLTILTNIYKTKDYPTYSTTPVSYTKVTSCSYYAAIYDSANNLVYLVQPGKSIFAVISSSITVPTNVFFMQCMPGPETSILTILSTAGQGGSANIYKLYEVNPSMVMNFGIQNVSTDLSASFQLQVSSAVSAQAIESVIFNSIAFNQTLLTLQQDSNLVQNTVNNLLTVGYQQDTSYFFNFEQQKMYKGIIQNFYISCQQSQDCNSKILINNVIDKQRTIARNHKFTDVAPGNTGKFTYGQSQSKVWRFIGYMNQVYDMVQFPVSDPHIYCTKLAISELDQFSISACGSSDISSDFATPIENEWRLFAVSYISTEPFTMGSFKIQAQFINKMVILDKYLFVFDADQSIDQYFSAVYVYQFNFDNFTMYPTWYQYVGKLTLGQITPSSNRIFTSFDVVKTAIPGRYRFTFSTMEGWMITQTYDLTIQQPFANYLEYFQIYILPMLSIKQQTNAICSSITLFNLNTTTLQSTGDLYSNYNALFVFKNISSFEAKVSFCETQQTLKVEVLTEYVQYGYYQSQPNPKIIGDFIVFTGVLPEPLLQKASPTTAKQVLFVYQRSNASGTQIPILQQTTGITSTIISSGYSFYNSLNMFPFTGQLFYNKTSQMINSSILLINPDTNTLDHFWLKPNVTFEFVDNSVKSANVDLYARNDFMTMFCGTYKITIESAPGSHKKHPYWIIGVVLGSVAGVAIIAVAIWQYNKRKNNAQTPESENLMNN